MSIKSTNITGQKFSRLTAISIVEKPKDSMQRSTFWLCLCDCGNKIITRGTSLRSQHTKSCGCLQKTQNGFSGKKRHPMYRIWVNIKKRCFNPNCKQYKYYGDRGITICNKW